MEQSNIIEKQLIPMRVSGKIMYRCPYTDCRKKFDRRQSAIDHIRSVHLQLKKFCELCEKNVSFVSYNRHVRSCIGRKVASATNQATISNHVTRSATMNVQQEQKFIDQVFVDNFIPKVEQALPKQIGLMQTPSGVVNEIAHLWSYERSREDEFDLFGKFVASEMRVLARSAQFHLKRRIQQLLLEYDPADQSVSTLVAMKNNHTIEPNNLENGMPSDQICSDEMATPNNSQNVDSMDYGSLSLVSPKLEPVVRDNVLTSLNCLVCKRRDSDLFHENLNEINTAYSHTRILDIIEEWLGSLMPNVIESGVCCDACLRKINKYDLNRLNLEKILQSNLLTDS